MDGRNKWGIKIDSSCTSSLRVHNALPSCIARKRTWNEYHRGVGMLDKQHLAVSVSTSSKLSMCAYECGDQTPAESEQTLHDILNKSFCLLIQTAISSMTEIYSRKSIHSTGKSMIMLQYCLYDSSAVVHIAYLRV